MVPSAKKAADLLEKDGISAGVVNARFIKPMDTDLLSKHASEAKLIVTLENGIITGGFGAGVEDHVGGQRSAAQVLKLGWPDEFVTHGSQDILFSQYGLDPDSIATAVKKACDAQDQA